MENEVRSLLNPLLVRPSARSLVGTVYTPSTLIRLSACPPVCLYSACRPPIRPPSAHPPVRLSFAPRLPVHPSASRPSLSPHPPLSALVRLSTPRPPRPHLPKITYHFLLLESFLPLVRHVRSPRLHFIALVGAIVASGYENFPPYVVNPRLTLLCCDREVCHDPSCRDVMTPS